MAGCSPAYLPALGENGYRGQKVIYSGEEFRESYPKHLLKFYEMPYEFTISSVRSEGYVLLDELRNSLFIYFEIAEKYFYDKSLWEAWQESHPDKK
jgi:hypothetical protein